MKRILLGISMVLSMTLVSSAQDGSFDMTHWKLELPTGYKASDWKLSNFRNDRFAKPFFYIDSLDGALVMEAYPAEGSSKAKYTRNTLREQMQPGSNDLNWTFKEGGVLEVEFQVTKMSKDESGKYHKTILFQIDGRTTEKQTELLGLEKPKSMPFLKIFWQNERLRMKRRVLKDESLVGDALLEKTAWKEDDGTILTDKIGFEKVKIRIEIKKGKLTIQINDEKPRIIRDINISQWYFENYFTVGNYLQTKDEGAHSIVKYYRLDVNHNQK
ncbi:MAG: polysaccharide lyase family 7 protein [Bacteroidota bacterium]